MANGVAHALHALAPEPPSAPAPVGVSSTEIEAKIGEEVASGVVLLCRAIVGHQQTGILPPGVKDAVATQVAAIVMLQLDHGSNDDADFIRKARQAGYARLHKYFDGYDIPPDADPDAAVDICISEMLGLVAQIIKDERIFRAVWAN